MKKKFKHSLFAKVFTATAILLLGMSFLVFGLLAWLMPQTYSSRLNAALDKQAQNLIAELKHAAFRDSGGLFDQFLQNPEISSVELYSDHGDLLPLPSGYTNGDTTLDAAAVQENICYEDSSYEDIPILSNSYYFSFADADTKYMLIVYGTGDQIYELQLAFARAFPVLAAVCLLAALAAALLYSHIITKPVVNISRISEKMSDLQFEWQLDETRYDELGTLEKSLNGLSKKLSAAISDLQAANRKLAEDFAREKALERAQLDFFSAVSHELKTPVTVIKGQLEGMLLNIGAYKDHKKYLARSLEITNTIERMIQEILTISRLETADYSLRSDHLDASAIVRDYLSQTEDLIVQKQLQVSCDMPPAAWIYANKMLIEKVFSNLIGNAVKYSPDSAEIHISIRMDQNRLHFSVENTGSHIPDPCMPKLFEAFYRIEQSRNRKTGGSGLGLYIVQKILHQYGCCCQISNTGSGVRFFFDMENHT